MLSLSVAKCLFKVNKKGTKKTTIVIVDFEQVFFKCTEREKKNDKSN